MAETTGIAWTDSTDAKLLADRINNADGVRLGEDDMLRAEEQNLIVDALRRYVNEMGKTADDFVLLAGAIKASSFDSDKFVPYWFAKAMELEIANLKRDLERAMSNHSADLNSPQCVSRDDILEEARSWASAMYESSRKDRYDIMFKQGWEAASEAIEEKLRALKRPGGDNSR